MKMNPYTTIQGVVLWAADTIGVFVHLYIVLDVTVLPLLNVRHSFWIVLIAECVHTQTYTIFHTPVF